MTTDKVLMRECPTCEGGGEIATKQIGLWEGSYGIPEPGFGILYTPCDDYTECPECEGTGEIIWE